VARDRGAWVWAWVWRRREPTPAELGPRGERAAAGHLKRRGYRVVARNLRTRHGELDLLALTPDRSALVIVEVKAGRAASPIPPEVHVTPVKRRKIVALAARVARSKRLAPRPIRFDVIAVAFDHRRVAWLRHHEGAFTSHV